MWFFGLNATFRAATLERQHYKVMLWAWFPNFVKFVVSSSFECNYFWNYSSFIRCGNCERFSFSWNLSAFASQCLNSRLRALHKFFGQEDHPSLKSEGAPATLVTVVENKTKQGDTKASCDKMETFLVTLSCLKLFRAIFVVYAHDKLHDVLQNDRLLCTEQFVYYYFWFSPVM